MGQVSPRTVPRTSAKGKLKVISSLDKLYSLAKYLVASSEIKAILDTTKEFKFASTKQIFTNPYLEMFFARILILAEADMNHSGDFGFCRASLS